MKERDWQDAELTNIDDDEIRITDLEVPTSPQQRAFLRGASLTYRGLARPGIRYSLSGMLLLILLGTLILQWPRPAPTTPSVAKTLPSAFFEATSTSKLIFIQTLDYGLTAYQATTGRQIWHDKLPALAFMYATDQQLYCYFAIAPNQTKLEALDTHTGQIVWHDTLPAAVTSVISTGISLFGNHSSEGPTFFYEGHVIFIHTTSDTIYAIQANDGRINWTYHAQIAPRSSSDSTPTPQSSERVPFVDTLEVQNGVVEFLSMHFALYFLNASTGQEILHIPSHNSVFTPLIDGQTIYLLPQPNEASAILAFHIPDGRFLWNYSLPQGAWAENEQDGMVYLNEESGSTVVALNGRNGRKLWGYQSSDNHPMLNEVESGVSYSLQQDSTVVAIRVSDGRVLWRTRLPQRISQSTTFFVDHDYLIFYDSNVSGPSAFPLYALNADNGILLWHQSPLASLPFPRSGFLYTLQNNGQLDVWRESDGRHLWNYSAPVGSSIVWTDDAPPNLLFLQDTIGNFYVLNNDDGKQLWHYP